MFSPRKDHWVFLDECDSTNAVALRKLEAGAPDGTVIVSKTQTAGRGRMGRTWISETGNLHCSVIFSVPSHFPPTWLSLAVGSAALKALRKTHPGISLDLKWPNDIVVPVGSGNRAASFGNASSGHAGWAKVGGILCERVHGNRLIAGIGVNLVHAPDLDHVQTAALQSRHSPRLIAEQIVEVLAEKFSRSPESVVQEAHYSLSKSAYLRPGDTVEIREPGASGQGTRVVGNFLGFGDQGELIYRDPTGLERRAFSEEIRVLGG